MNPDQTICKRCVMDSTVPDIKYYEDGRCNLCKNYDEVLVNEIHDNLEGKEKINSLVNKIKSESRKGKYDCLIGVSGALIVHMLLI